MSERQSSDGNNNTAPPQPPSDPPTRRPGTSSPSTRPPRPRGDYPPERQTAPSPADSKPTGTVPFAASASQYGPPGAEPETAPVPPERSGSHRAGPDETTVFVPARRDFSHEPPRQAPREAGEDWASITEAYIHPAGELDRLQDHRPTTAPRRPSLPPSADRLERTDPTVHTDPTERTALPQRAGPRPGEPGADYADSWAAPNPPAPARGDDGRDWNQAQGSAAHWSYVDNIRSSELVPTRRIPPARGWRKVVYFGSFKVINLGQSPDERYQAELEAKIRSLLRGKYKIGVLGKGGVGKTTVAACVGSVFAELRQDDRVVAVDADTAFGKLASRIDPNTSGSYWELASDSELYGFSDIRSRVGSNNVGLFVLAGEKATARRRVIDPAVYREATAQLDKHFTLSIIDCSATMDAPVTREVLGELDALIVVSSPWFDGAKTAGETLEWLANGGYTGLLHRSVVVINDSDGHADKRELAMLIERFGGRGQKVIELPYDAHLRPAGVIDIQNEINRLTRRRLFELAAACAEHFAATTDRKRALTR
jgi:MinD-like ATPase involved in chromosome partitioning or flagellar assembly